MKRFIRRNSSTILTILGGVGVVVTAVSAAKATVKAVDILEEAKLEKGEELTISEKIIEVGPVYIPAVISGVATVACIFGANILNKKHQATLVSAYALLDNSYKDYKRKLIELYGDETHQNVVDAIAIEKAEKTYASAPSICGNSVLYLDDDCYKKELFYFEFANRFFEATLEQVISAEYHLNRNYILRGYITLNEFYDFLGIESNDAGDELAWTIDDDEIYWIDFNHRKAELKDYGECVVIEVITYPRPDWKEMWGFI